MGRDLTAFLAGRTPVDTEHVAWGSAMRLRRSAYVDPEMPPAAVITSVRAIVTRDDTVLVAEDEDGLRHILPGGRIEVGEEIEAALRREIAEETGWAIRDIAPLGFLHFLHLTPRPARYPYPYPSFVQVVFTARADTHLPGSVLPDDFVVGSSFLDVPRVRDIGLTRAELQFLGAAFPAGGCKASSHPSETG